jgi:ubiquinone/menaquinone biosynthesis C-methylase UbiE
MDVNDTVWKSDTLAGHYLEGVRGAIPLADEQLRLMLHLVHAAVPRPRRLLDLGCGDGVLGRAAVDRFPDARVVFVDFSDYMLDAARMKLGAQAPHHAYLPLDYGDPAWVDALGDEPFDAILSGFSIHHQPDDRKHRLYGQLFDLLAPGGLFLNLEHVASASDWGTRLFDAYFIDALHHFHVQHDGTRTREAVAADYYHRPDKNANILAPVETQCAWLREIGFTRVDCFFKVFELALFGGCKPPAQ